MTLKQSEVLRQVPVFHSGRRKGQARNEALREIQRKLSTYKYSAFELDLFQQDIINNTPKKYRAEESE